MFSLNDTMRYFLCPGKTDMRKGMNSLCGVVQNQMGYDVRMGDVFIFISRNRTTIKLLHAEDGGLVLYIKRLEEGTFRIPAYDAASRSYPMEWRDLVMMVEGIREDPDSFYRQVRQFKHLGLDIAETTLNGWFKPACELLKPLYEVLKTEVLETDYIQVDETTLPVIDKEKRKAAKEYLWTVRSVMKRMIFFHYENGSRSTRTVTQLLGTYHGHLQSDGYKAYDAFNDNDDVTQIACMAHIRRHFETGLKENKALAEFALSQIQLLYRLEKKADEENVSYQERAAMRDQYARPIIESLEAWMEKTHPLFPDLITFNVC